MRCPHLGIVYSITAMEFQLGPASHGCWKEVAAYRGSTVARQHTGACPHQTKLLKTAASVF